MINLPSHEQTSQLLKKQFTKPRLSIFDRLIGEPSEYNYRIDGVEHFGKSNFFEKHIFCIVSAGGRFLEHKSLPHGGSFGLFAFDGAELHYLHGAPATRAERLSSIFRNENKAIDLAPTNELANLLAESQLRNGLTSHEVIADKNALFTYNPWPKRVNYEVDEHELMKVEDSIAPLTISRESDGSWTVTFTTIHGDRYQKSGLSVHTFIINSDFEIGQYSELLSTCIYKNMEVPQFIH
ncbi:MAG TPA: hypothetical protein V6C97_12445 [Oculatellaceae cyanobacterium]